MNKANPLLRIQLGQTLFILQGLSSTQITELSQAWGPFLSVQHSLSTDKRTDSQMEKSQEGSAKETWFIQYKTEAWPQRLTSDYQRADDLFLVIESTVEKRVLSWIDGSLGAIEASVQVILQKALASRGGFLVHASAGVYQGRGILFPGVSGTGKSTIAREAGFDEVLSDEMVIIEFCFSSSTQQEHHGYQLYSTPFWSEGRSLPLIISNAPLALMCIPQQANQAKLLPCTQAEAISHLLSAITLYEDSDTTSVHRKTELFHSACHLCAQIPSQKLLFPKIGPWLDLLSWPKGF